VEKLKCMWSDDVTALQEKFRTEKEVVMATLWDEALLRLQDVQEKMQAAYDEQLANARDKGALLVEHAAHELNDQIHLLRIEAQAQAQHAQERLEEEVAQRAHVREMLELETRHVRDGAGLVVTQLLEEHSRLESSSQAPDTHTHTHTQTHTRTHTHTHTHAPYV
jgi:F0F1-type ATP synthase membrane subunit b/b'